MSNKPKILVLDIETKPIKAYTWRLYDVTIGLDQIIENGGTLCFGAKWLNEKQTYFYSEWDDGHEAMIRAAHALISEADAIVTYNGDKFDLPKLQGEFLLYGLKPPPPTTSIDVLKTVRKMGLTSNKLAFVGPLLAVGRKIKHAGFQLWVDVLDGKERAQVQMRNYCLQDVRLLEKVYNKVRPFIKNHPHLGSEKGSGACGACGSNHVQSRGYRRTKSFRIQRLQCQSCGGWSDGKREKIG